MLLLSYFLFSCICVCDMNTSMCVYMCVGCACTCTRLWRTKIEVRKLPHCSSLLFFLRQSLSIKPRLDIMTSLPVQLSQGLTFKSWHYKWAIISSSDLPGFKPSSSCFGQHFNPSPLTPFSFNT